METQTRTGEPSADRAGPPRRPTVAPAAGAERFFIRLDLIGETRLRVRASGPSGTVETDVPLPIIEAPAVAGDADAAWARARRVGLLLYAAAVPPPVERLLEESRHRLDERPLPIVLEIADPKVARLPWELLREPERDRFLALSERTPLSRSIDDRAGPAPAPPVLDAGPLRLRLRLPTADDTARDAALLVAADPRVVAPVAEPQTPAKDRPHVVQSLDGGLDPDPRGAGLAVITGGLDDATALIDHVPAVILLPSTLDRAAATTFLTALYAALAAGSPLDRATVGARRAVADDQGLHALAWAAPVLLTKGAPRPLVAPGRRLAAVGATVKEQTVGWLRDTLSGVVSSVVLFLVGLVFFRLGFSSSSEFELDILSPYSLYQSFKGLVLELSTFQEHLLLIAAAALLGATGLVALLRFRHRRAAAATGFGGRVVGAAVGLRTVTFLTMATLTVAGAYAYQQYLWNVLLPIASGDLGLAITRQAAAASLREELAFSLRSEGPTQQIVVRELPVNFDATDVGKARALGRRIAAEAVLIYREDDTDEDGAAPYVAHVVFTDPAIDLVVGTSGDAASGDPAAATSDDPMVRFEQGLPVPTLRTQTVTELVEAAAGIIAYNQGRIRQAIAHLELALPSDPDAPNTGIVNFYLGLAHSDDDQSTPAAAAFERAAAYYERRRAAGDALGTQDILVLVKTYYSRGRVAFFEEDYASAIAWSTKSLDLRDDLLARAGGLERPPEIHATFAALYAQLASAHRATGNPADETRWTERASAELDDLAAAADPDDAEALTEQGTARFFIGECVPATAALDRALAIDPSDADAHVYAGVVALLQGRSDLAEDHYRRVMALRPDDVTARQLLALQRLGQSLGGDDGYFEPVYLAQGEALYREIERIDPANLDAHEELADLAEWRAEAATVDLSAIHADDPLTASKSVELWRDDPTRHRTATEAFSAAIEQRRVLATELRPGDVGAQLALASVSRDRQSHLYYALLAVFEAGDLARIKTDGEVSAADAASVRALTDAVLASDSGATRTQRLQAWNLAVDAVNEEWAWYRFEPFAPAVSPWSTDPLLATRAELLQIEWQEDVAAALAFVAEAEPANGDEQTAMAGIYNSAYLAEMFFGDEAAAQAHYDRWLQLATAANDEATAASSFSSTFCAEERERSAAAALADDGDLVAARTRYEAALAINPAYPPALTGLGALLFAQGDPVGAIERAETATKATPDAPRGWADLGRYRLARGETEASDAAYDRFLGVAGRLPPQARMAALRAALGDLRSLVDGRPDLTMPVVALVPRFVGFLDGMAAEGEATFQYPQLYASLGSLLLFADDAATAEPLLRRALALDPHLPAIHAQLWLAVIAQGRDGAAELAGAATELADELWTKLSATDPEGVAASMTAEATRYAERFPDRAARAREFEDALATERERTRLSTAGVVGTAYTGPTFGLGLTWDPAWPVDEVASDDTAESVRLVNGTSDVLVESAAAYLDPATCRDEATDRSSATPSWRDFTPALGAGGRPLAGSDADRAYAIFTFSETAADGPPGDYAVLIECRPLVPGQSGVLIAWTAPLAAFNQQLPLVEALLAALRQPGAGGAPVPGGPIPPLSLPAAGSAEPSP